MTLLNETELIKKMVGRAKRMYNLNEIPYEWNEVVNLIEVDPDIFAASLRRATRYKLPLGAPKSHKLWITCNMARGYMIRKDCYFCGKIMKREEFLAGNVHPNNVQLEHLDPRSRGGEHTPINITLVCKTCNLLKHDLRAEDFDLILNDPEAFRAAHPKMSLRTYQKLLDFAVIISIPLKGNCWIVDRFGVTGQNLRQFCDQLRFDYREKWGVE